MVKLIYVNPNPSQATQMPVYEDTHPGEKRRMPRLAYDNPNPIRYSGDFDDLKLGKAAFIPSFSSYSERVLANFLPHFTTRLSCHLPFFYKMSVCDPSHYLSCELSLEVETNEDESVFGDVICHFPSLNMDYLKAFVWEDATLISSITVQFYIRILEQLLVFCGNHNALKLFIYADSINFDLLRAYEEFTEHRGGTLIIPTDRATYDRLIWYMEQTSIELRETLVEEQHANPVIRQYLKLSTFT